jgi:GNAT superfamily N-acetyltransferase
LNIRRYRRSDQGAVIALFREFMCELAPPALGVQFQNYVERAIDEELGKIEEYYLGREGQGFWIADDGRVVGMVGIERHGGDAGELRRMAVEKANRRKGIGRMLLGVAETFCRDYGYRRVMLSTSELQAAAARLYESAGYRRVREERDAPASHKSVGAGLARYDYEKSLT